MANKYIDPSWDILSKQIEENEKRYKVSEEKLSSIFLEYEKTKDLELRDIIFYNNTRLIFDIMKNYETVPGYNTYKCDIFEAASVTLINCISTFKPHLGYKFSTYATWAIRNGIATYINTYMRKISIPNDIVLDNKYIESAQSMFMEKNHREGTAKEIAPLTANFTKDHKALTEDRVQLVIDSYKMSYIEMDDYANGDKNSEDVRGDFIPNEDEDTPAYANRLNCADVLIALMEKANLTEEEKRVYVYANGLFGMPKKTLEEIAKEHQPNPISKQAVSKTLNKAIRKILDIMSENPFQNPPYYEKLVGDLEGYYSRRLNTQHRMVYRVIKETNTIVVHSMWTHYEK